jgi:hypothetical protein
MSGEQLSTLSDKAPCTCRKVLEAHPWTLRRSKCYTMQHEIEKTTARNSRAACNPMQHEIKKTVPSSKRPGVVAAGITFCRRPDRLFAKRTQFPAGARSH